MLPTDTLFAKPVSRLVCALVAGAGAAFVLGSFIAFFVMFNNTAIQGQAAPSAKPVIFRVYAAIFLLVTLGFHLYASLTFRYSESKKVFDLSAPRPVACAVIVGLLLIANVIPTGTEMRDDSKFEHADNPFIRETKFGWPGYFVSFYDEHGKKETRTSMSLLIVNGLILLLGLANVATYDPASRTMPTPEEEKEEAEKKKKSKKSAPPEDYNWVPPQMAGGGEPPRAPKANEPPKELEL
jgi:hypothetical protein